MGKGMEASQVGDQAMKTRRIRGRGSVVDRKEGAGESNKRFWSMAQ